jgi:hypothetical protein
MIECQECGEVYGPETDAYRCPVCGAENYPDGGGPGEPCSVCGGAGDLPGPGDTRDCCHRCDGTGRVGGEDAGEA